MAVTHIVGLETAPADAILRCSGCGAQDIFEKGDDLPICSCEEGGQWFFLANDNFDGVPDVVYCNSGVEYIMYVGIPEVGLILNLLNVGVIGLQDGLYQVNDVSSTGDDRYLIRTSRIGDRDPELPVYTIQSCGC